MTTGRTDPPVGAADDVRLTAWVQGRVQEVGFRWFTRSTALGLGLVGTATNLADGRVEVVAEGPRPACEALLAALPDGPGRVTHVGSTWAAARGGLAGFRER